MSQHKSKPSIPSRIAVGSEWLRALGGRHVHFHGSKKLLEQQTVLLSIHTLTPSHTESASMLLLVSSSLLRTSSNSRCEAMPNNQAKPRQRWSRHGYAWLLMDASNAPCEAALLSFDEIRRDCDVQGCSCSLLGGHFCFRLGFKAFTKTPPPPYTRRTLCLPRFVPTRTCAAHVLCELIASALQSWRVLQLTRVQLGLKVLRHDGNQWSQLQCQRLCNCQSHPTIGQWPSQQLL